MRVINVKRLTTLLTNLGSWRQTQSIEFKNIFIAQLY